MLNSHIFRDFFGDCIYCQDSSPQIFHSTFDEIEPYDMVPTELQAIMLNELRTALDKNEKTAGISLWQVENWSDWACLASHINAMRPSEKELELKWRCDRMSGTRGMDDFFRGFICLEEDREDGFLWVSSPFQNGYSVKLRPAENK